MSRPPEAVPCKEHLPEVYRFAFLMTGSAEAATEVLRRTVERAARGGIGDLRDPRRVRRWLFSEARQHCGGPLTAAPLPPVPDTVAHGNEGHGGANGQHGSNGAGGAHGTNGASAVHADGPPGRVPLPDNPPLPLVPDAAVPTGPDGASAWSAQHLATAFTALPERERCALVLFYLQLFSPADLAEALELRPDALGPVLLQGRHLLKRQFQIHQHTVERPAALTPTAVAAGEPSREFPG